MTLSGDRLEFQGAVPWVGRYAAGEHAGRRVSFGDVPPAEDPAPESWEHYAPDAVILHGAKGTTTLAPVQFQRNARLGYFVITFIQDLLIATVFFFLVGILIRFKRVSRPGAGPLVVLARCLIPACLYGAAFNIFGTGLAGTLSVGVFLLVLAMNALLYVLGTTPDTTAAAFDV